MLISRPRPQHTGAQFKFYKDIPLLFKCGKDRINSLYAVLTVVSQVKLKQKAFSKLTVILFDRSRDKCGAGNLFDCIC